MASLFSKLFGQSASAPTPQPTEQKRSSVGPMVALHDVGRPLWTARTGTALTQAGYRQNPVVYRCVRLIAEAAASVAINVFEAQTEHDSHPVSDLLARPNPREAGSQFFESLYGYLLLNGNAYLECVSVNGVARELYALRPDRMRVILGRDGWPEGYEYTVGADKHIFNQDEKQPPILHLKLFDPLDDQYGMSPLAAGQMALDTHNVAGSWNKALLDNSARPSGALVYSSDGANMSDTQFDRLKDELESAFQGSMNAGRPILLEGGLDWKPLSMSPKDMDFMEAKGMAAREIALAFGVPPLLLGLPGDNTYANYAEANRAFWRQSVLPLLNRTFGSIAHWLSPSFGADFRLEPDLDRIEALSGERNALWARVDSASFLDRNEKRQAVGYGATEGTEAEIAVVDIADEAGVDDPEAEINKLKARLYDLEQKYPGQPHDELGRFTFGTLPEKIDPKKHAKIAMSPACFSEWIHARSTCFRWLNSANPRDYSTGGYRDVESCARGLVSAACGGNGLKG
jgi:HK97 family phage portal protein